MHACMQTTLGRHLSVWEISIWPVGRMDKASASGAGDSRFGLRAQARGRAAAPDFAQNDTFAHTDNKAARAQLGEKI